MFPTILAPRYVSDQQPVALKTSYPPKKFGYYFKYLENNPDILKQQYAIIKERSAEFALTLKTNIAKLPENRRKNRYTNISPCKYKSRDYLLYNNNNDRLFYKATCIKK